MAGHFFTSWATWVKLVFILGCGIFATIAVGYAKLWYTRRKLRKYSEVANATRQEQELQLRSGQIPADTLEEVPFGIRALESGIEVEGIWISRSNTPESTSRQGSALGPLPRPHINILSQNPMIATDLFAPKLNGSGSVLPDSTSFERAVSAERLPSGRPSRDSSSDASLARGYNSRCPPLSYAKYSNHPQLRRYTASSSTSGLHDYSQRGLANGLEFEDGTTDISKSTKQSTLNSSDESGSMTGSTPSLSTIKHQAQEDALASFELMQLHRLALAAETGQLTPPARRSCQDGSSGRPSLSSRRASSNDEANYFDVKLKPEDARNNANSGDFTDHTELDITQSVVRKNSLPDVKPFTQYSQHVIPSSYLSGPIHVGSASARPKTRLHRSPAIRIPNVPELAESTPAPAGPDSTAPECGRAPTEKEGPQVLRGHGTGFEILKPGSFESYPSAGNLEEHLPTAPPISLNNAASRGRSNNSDGRRKLTKKQRGASKESGRSSDTDRRSQTSTL